MPLVATTVATDYSLMRALSPWSTTPVNSYGWMQESGYANTTNATSTTTYTNVQNVMFIPTGSGTLFYHTIGATLSVPFYQSDRPIQRPLAHPNLITGRRALRRSIRLFQMLRPVEEVKKFLDGDPIIVHGRRFDYSLRKRIRLLSHTINPTSAHIPYDLCLLDKGTGKVLAKGCVIIPDTPVIDQVIAVIMHIEDPREEIKLLTKTNWTPGITQHLRGPELALAA